MISPNSRPAPEMAASFQRAGKILLLTHHNPDGDALGSVAALALALQKQGKGADIYLTGGRQDNLEFLLEGQNVLAGIKTLSPYDLIVLLDCHDFSRLGPEGGPALLALWKAMDPPPPVAVIDHHLLDENEAPLPLWLCDPAASSTGELVLRLLKDLCWEYSPEAAEALLLAIASDTGFFSQSNSGQKTLLAAADLVAAGASLERVDRRLRRNWPLRRLRLMALALSALEIHHEGRAAVTSVTPAMLSKAGAEMQDSEDLVEMGRALAGVRVSALIKDYGTGPGTVRVGLRSREGVSARDIAKAFGGGGHLEASAYNDPLAPDAESAKTRLLAELGKHL